MKSLGFFQTFNSSNHYEQTLDERMEIEYSKGNIDPCERNGMNKFLSVFMTKSLRIS